MKIILLSVCKFSAAYKLPTYIPPLPLVGSWTH
jgi:hypothetical protein